MRRMHRGLVAAIEEEEVAVAPTEELNNAESLETELLEVNDSATEGAEDQAQVDEATDAVEALESMIVAMESAVANGGLDRNGAMMMNIGVESIYARVGIESNRRSSPALESFGGTSSRIGSTQLALEDMKEKAAEIWKAIVAAITRAVEWVVDHFNKMFGAAEKLQKRAEAVMKKAEGQLGKQKNNSFDNSALFKKLAIGNNVSNMGGAAAALNKTAQQALLNDVEIHVAATEEFANMLDDIDNKGPNFKLAPSGSGSKVGENEGFSTPNGMQTTRGIQMPGGVAMIEVGPASPVQGTEALEMLAKCYSKIVKFDPKAQEAKGEKLPTLSSSDIQSIAKEVVGVGEKLEQFRKPFAKLEKALKDVKSKAEKVGKQANSEEAADKKALYAAARKGCSNVPRYLSSAPASFSVYALNTSKALLDYCEQSLKQYEGK